MMFAGRISWYWIDSILHSTNCHSLPSMKCTPVPLTATQAQHPPFLWPFLNYITNWGNGYLKTLYLRIAFFWFEGINSFNFRVLGSCLGEHMTTDCWEKFWGVRVLIKLWNVHHLSFPNVLRSETLVSDRSNLLVCSFPFLHSKIVQNKNRTLILLKMLIFVFFTLCLLEIGSSSNRLINHSNRNFYQRCPNVCMQLSVQICPWAGVFYGASCLECETQHFAMDSDGTSAFEKPRKRLLSLAEVIHNLYICNYRYIVVWQSRAYQRRERHLQQMVRVRESQSDQGRG